MLKYTVYTRYNNKLNTNCTVISQKRAWKYCCLTVRKIICQTIRNIWMVLNSDAEKSTTQDSYQLWFWTVILRSLPFKIHISFAPNVFSSSFEEHLFIETAEIYGTRYTDIKDGFGRNFAASSAVQETHLIGQTNKKCKISFCFICHCLQVLVGPRNERVL